MWSMRISTLTVWSLLGLQMIYNLFLFQTMRVFCFDIDKMEVLEGTLGQTFGYAFNNSFQYGGVLIWKISGNHEPFTPLQYNGEDFQFGSEDTYLLFTQRYFKEFIIYYWLGRNTSLIDKQVAAKYALLLAQFPKTVPMHMFPWIQIARENEGIESDSFKLTYQVLNRHVGYDDMPVSYFTDYLNKSLPSPRPNLYVVRGIPYSRMKKIPFSLGLHWLTNEDTCLVIELEYKVKDRPPMNVYCGTKAKINLTARSSYFACKFYGYSKQRHKKEDYSDSIDNNKHSHDFKQFVEILEDTRLYNPNEVDDSGDHLLNAAEFVNSRDQTVSLFDITMDELKVNRRRPISASIFQYIPSQKIRTKNYSSMHIQTGYLLDTKSVAGVFLVFTDSGNINNRVKAIQLAEKYLNETHKLSSGQTKRMRILEVKFVSHILDFGINL